MFLPATVSGSVQALELLRSYRVVLALFLATPF